METLYSRFQVADSSNQVNPYRPGNAVMDYPCTRMHDGRCMSHINHHAGAPEQWIENPPPEEHPSMQHALDRDVVGRGMSDHKHQPMYRDTVGTSASDISRGQMLLPSAYDMPIVRRIAFFDTRYRDPHVHPDAGRVMFELETPLTSVSRIALVSTRVPINLANNPGLQPNDYVMLSIGLNLQDRVTVRNNPDTTAVPPIPAPEPAFARALAYVPLIPHVAGATYSILPPSTPPYTYYTDFLKPIPSIERIELSWHRFSKSAGVTNYIITPPILGPGETPYDVDKNASALIVFFGKNRRPE